MTSPGGGNTGEINLAQLWIPVMPETSKVGESLRRAGEEGRREFEAGFSGGSGGAGIGASFGQKFGDEVTASLGGLSKTVLNTMQTGFSDGGVAIGAAFGGAIGGAVGSTLMSALEAPLHLIEKGFETGIEAAEKFAEEIVDVGVKFEELHRSILLATTASGSALEEFKSHSDALASTLDTTFDKVGTDMATFASRLGMEASPALDKLTHDVEELRDRFGSLDVTALAGAFDQFQVSGEHADQTLASLVHSARQFGVGLNQLVTDLAEAGPTLQEFNLSAEQSGHLLAELEAKHISAAAAVNVLAKAQKAAGEQNRDIKEFVASEIQVIQDYAAAGDKAAADQEAFLAFGAKNWVAATTAAKAYLETLQAGPDAFRGNTAEMDHFIALTQSLDNRWEALKNKMTVAFAPLASVALDGITKAMSSLGEWISSHQDQILGFVKKLGEDFINAIPGVEAFAAATLKLVGGVGDNIAKALGAAMVVIGRFGESLHSIPGLAKILGPLAETLADNGQALERTGESLINLNLNKYTDQWADGIKRFRPDLQGMTKDLDAATDSMRRQLDALNNASSAVGDTGPQNDIGHIAPPATTFGAQPPDESAPGADPGAEGGLPGGDQPPEGAVPQVKPRSWTPAPPPSDGVGGPQHVRFAGWHEKVEQADWLGGHRQSGGEGGGHGGSEHGGIFGGEGHRPEKTGPTSSQQRQHSRHLEDLNDNISDYDDSITDLTQQQKDAGGKLSHDTALRDTYQQGSLTWIEENKAVIADQKAYAHATKELTRTLRDRKRAEEDIVDENAKFADEQKGRHGGSGEGSGDANAQRLGQGLLSGVMGDLGLGNVFGGRSPLDWVLPKMITGALDWGLNALGGGGGDGGAAGGDADAGGDTGGGGGGGLLGPLSRLLNPGGAGPFGAGGGEAVGGAGGPQATPFIFGGQGQAFGPAGTAPGPGQGVAQLPGVPAAPGTSAQRPAPPAAPPGDSIIPGAPAPTPVPTPHAALTPGMHYTGFDSGGGGATPGGLSQAGWHAAMPAFGGGGGGGVQTAGYTAAAAPRIAQLASAVGGKAGAASTIYNGVLQAGYSPKTATAAVAAAQYESGLNSTIQEKGGSDHWGLFQEQGNYAGAHGSASDQTQWFVDQLNRLGGPSVIDQDPTNMIADKVEIGGYSGSKYDMGAASQLLTGLGVDDTAAAGGGASAPYTPAAFTPAGFAGGMGNANTPALDNPASVASRVPNAPNVEAGIRRMGGLPTLYDTKGANAYQVPGWTQQLAKDFGLTASTYASGGSLHQMGYAFDFNGPQDKMDAFADYVQQNLSPQTLQLIHASGQRRWGIASGQDVSAGGYYAGDYGGHFDHVHWATDVPPIMGDQAAAGVDDAIVGGGASLFAPAGFQNAAAVPPGGPVGPPPAFANVPNVNPMTGQPHYTGPTLPGPVQQQPNASSGVNIQSNPQGSFAQQSLGGLMSGLFSVLGSQIGSPDYNPRNWQGILREPDWQGVQHQHQPVQSAQSIVQNFDHSIDLSGSTVANPAALQQSVQEMMNSRFNTIAGGLPQSGIGSP